LCLLRYYEFQTVGSLLGSRPGPRRATHEPVGERHERYAARFGLDPAPGRAFIASLGFRGLSLEDGPMLRLEWRYDQPIERVWRALTTPASSKSATATRHTCSTQVGHYLAQVPAGD
jgi:hypothetical protein